MVDSLREGVALVVYRSLEEFENEHTFRAHQECECPVCGRFYIDHPYAREPHNLSFIGVPFLHRLCTGWLVKL